MEEIKGVVLVTYIPKVVYLIRRNSSGFLEGDRWKGDKGRSITLKGEKLIELIFLSLLGIQVTEKNFFFP